MIAELVKQAQEEAADWEAHDWEESTREERRLFSHYILPFAEALKPRSSEAIMAKPAPFIVGIGHRARVGKDTAAEALCRDLNFTRVGFADKLKALAWRADPIVSPGHTMVNMLDRHRLAWVVAGHGWERAKDVFPQVREFLQNLGVGAREVFGQDFWIDQALRDLTGPTVVADVRFRNEADAIKALGGVVIDIERAVAPTNSHVSETELDGYDFDEVFVNDKGVTDLQATVVAWVKNRMER